MKNKKVLFLKNNFFGRTAKIHPKDGVSCLNFSEGFGSEGLALGLAVVGQVGPLELLKIRGGEQLVI